MKFDSFRTVTDENRIWGWLYKFQNTFLKSRKGIRITFFKSKSFHSVTRDRKKEFIKKLCLALKTGILSLVLVLYVSARKHSEWILQRLTLSRVFCTIVFYGVILSLVLGKVFSLEVPLIAPVIVSAVLLYWHHFLMKGFIISLFVNNIP